MRTKLAFFTGLASAIDTSSRNFPAQKYACSEKSQTEAAFTLIELLVVISIVSLLSSIALASLNSSREKARIGAGRYFAAQVDHALGDQAIGIWDFDECSGTSVADRSGNGNNGALVNGTAWSSDTPAGAGCSLSFDGVNDSVLVVNWPASSGSDSGAASFWMKFPSAQTNKGFLSIADRPLIYMGSGGAIQAYNSNGGYYASAGYVSYGFWHQFVYSWENDVLKIYIDGKLAGTNSWTTTFSRGVADLHFGSYATGNENILGQMDTVRIYGRALALSEIRELYALERGGLRIAAR